MKRKPWTKNEWKQKRAELIKDKVCSWCGSDNKLVVHHPQKWTDQTQEEYESLEGTIILCSKCHFAFHHGMNLCPVCKVKYKKTVYPTCFNCLPTERRKCIEDIRITYRETRTQCTMQINGKCPEDCEEWCD